MCCHDRSDINSSTEVDAEIVDKYYLRLLKVLFESFVYLLVYTCIHLVRIFGTCSCIHDNTLIGN